MIVTISENVRLHHTNDGNWTIEARKTLGAKPAHLRKEGEVTKTGETKWEAVGYYGTIESCARGLADRHVHLLIEGEELTFHEFTKACRAAWSQIADACGLVTT